MKDETFKEAIDILGGSICNRLEAIRWQLTLDYSDHFKEIRDSIDEQTAVNAEILEQLRSINENGITTRQG